MKSAGKGGRLHTQIFYGLVYIMYRLPWWLSAEESTFQCRRHRFDPWVGKIPWRRKWQPTLVFLPGKSRGQRSWAGYNPWGHGVGHDLATKALQLCFGPWCWLTCSVCGLWFLMAPVFSSFLLPLPVCCRASCGTDSAWYGPSLCFHCFGSH